MTALERAIKKAGGVKTLAEACDVKYQAVQKWLKFDRLPAERVLEVEKATGISRHDLRPDLYPRDNAA